MIRPFKAAVFAVLLYPAIAAAAGTSDVQEIGWAQLLPPAEQAASLKSKNFMPHGGPSAPVGSKNPFGVPLPPPQTPEAPWLSSRFQQPGAGVPAQVVPELDGKKVRIGGYVVPLDFDATTVKEFLLVPFVGACIHVPPPPPNQIIYVKMEKGFEVTGQFDPIYVTGTLKTARQYTGLADTGYSMEATQVETRKE